MNITRINILNVDPDLPRLIHPTDSGDLEISLEDLNFTHNGIVYTMQVPDKIRVGGKLIAHLTKRRK